MRATLVFAALCGALVVWQAPCAFTSLVRGLDRPYAVEGPTPSPSPADVPVIDAPHTPRIDAPAPAHAARLVHATPPAASKAGAPRSTKVESASPGSATTGAVSMAAVVSSDREPTRVERHRATTNTNGDGDTRTDASRERATAVEEPAAIELVPR